MYKASSLISLPHSSPQSKLLANMSPDGATKTVTNNDHVSVQRLFAHPLDPLSPKEVRLSLPFERPQIKRSPVVSEDCYHSPVNPSSYRR